MSFLDKLQLFFENLPIKVLKLVLDGLASVVEAIPVPDFVTQTSISIPSEVSYFASSFMIAEGLGIVISAYTLRFLLRRIPIIG